MRRTGLSLVALALSVLLAGCDDDPSGPDRGELDLSSSMSFSYSGFVAGDFSVDTEIDPDGSAVAVDGALAAYGSEGADSTLLIVGIDRQEATVDLAVFSFYGVPTTGTYSLDFLACAEQAGSEQELTGCPLGGFDFGLPLNQSVESGFVYLIDSGEIALTGLTDTRVQGTFRAIVEVQDPETGEVVGEVEVADGRFDVPIIDVENAPMQNRIPLRAPRLQP